MKTSDRVTGYGIEDRGINRVSGTTGGGNNREHDKGVASPTTSGTGIGTSRVIESRGDRGYTSNTTSSTSTGVSGGYGKDRSTPAIPIRTSNVARDTVLLASPAIKESNSNLTSYITDLGASSRSGTITGTGNGTGSGTRTYIAGGDPSVTRTRTNGDMVPREDMDSSSYAHNIRGDSPTTRTTGDLITESYGRDLASGPDSYSRPLVGSFAPNSGNNISSRQNIASRFGLSTDPGAGNRSHLAGESSPPTDMSKSNSYSRDFTSGAGSRGYTIGEGSSSATKKVVDTATNAASYVGDVGFYMVGAGKDIASGMGLTSGTGSGYEGRENTPGKGLTSDSRTSTSTGINYGTYTKDEELPNYSVNGEPSTLPYTKGKISESGLAPGTDTGTREYDPPSHNNRTYNSGSGTPLTKTIASTATNAASYVADTAKDVVSGIGLTSGLTSGPGTSAYTDGRTYNNGGDYLPTKTNEDYGTLPYIKDVASSVAPDSSTSSRDRSYTSNDSITKSVADTAASTASYMVDTAKDVASGIGLGLGAPSRTNTVNGGTYPIENKVDSDVAPAGYNMDSKLSSGNNFGSQSSPIGGGTTLGSCPMPGGYSESRSNSYNLERTENRAGNGEKSSVSYRGGAYLSGNDSLGAIGAIRGKGVNGRMDGGDTIHPNQVTNQDREQTQPDHERVGDRRNHEGVDHQGREHGRIDGEHMDRKKMGAGSEQLGSLGERYIITHGGDATILNPGTRSEPEIGNGHEPPGTGEIRANTDNNRGTDSVSERAKGEHGEIPSIIHDDPNKNFDRVRLDLERENNNPEYEDPGITEGKSIKGATGLSTDNITSPGQKYSSLVSQEPGPLERYNRDSPKSQIQPTPGDNLQTQPGKPARKYGSPLDPIVEKKQEAHEPDKGKSVRESMERNRTADLSRDGSGPGGMKSTMRNSPEYREQKMDDSERVVTTERERENEVRGMVKSQFEEDDDDDDLGKKSLLGRAANKMGNLLKT